MPTARTKKDAPKKPQTAHQKRVSKLTAGGAPGKKKPVKKITTRKQAIKRLQGSVNRKKSENWKKKMKKHGGYA
jgi:hypothetical protein